MICPKCKANCPEGSTFCSQCGKKLTAVKERKKKSRGNKQGAVYFRKDRNCWEVQIVVGWKPSEKKEGRINSIKKTYSGYPTKKEALAALNKILNGETPKVSVSLLDDVFKAWKEFYKSRVTPKTLEGYELAYNHFSDLRYRRIASISAADLQKCMDDCEKGKRTHQLMKVTARLIWAYALDNNIVQKDVTANLYIGKHETTHREPLTPEDIKLIKDAIGSIKYSEYIYCMCYLGFRPGEFLEIKKNQVMTKLINKEAVYYITEGRKTEAGKDRIVVVPQQILPYIKERLAVKGTEYLFPMYRYRIHTDEFIGFSQMKTQYFNDFIFKPIMDQLGIEGKVPYSARHTYSDKLKHAAGDERDKAALMGHTSYDFTRKQYQSSPIEDLKVVTDSIK